MRIKPKTASTADSKGDLEVIDSTGKLGYHNGTTVSPVVTESHTATLTNKTIDADATGNVITNLENENIKAAAAIDATKIADGSVSDTEFQYLDGVTSSIQTQLNTNSTGLSDHIADPTDAHDASAISVIPVGNLVATNAQSAFAELDTDINTVGSDLGAHIVDPTDAHDASAISNVPFGNLSATDVQSALNELQTDIDTNATNLANHLSDAVDAHDASAISVVPSGNLAATEVQAALVELQGDINTINTDIADDVEGPASSTDNGIARFDGTTGKLIQDSSATISDTGVLTANELQIDSTNINGSILSNTVTGVSVNFSQGAASHIQSTADKQTQFGAIVFPSTTDASTGSNVTINPGTRKNIELTGALTSIDGIVPTTGTFIGGHEVTLINRTGGVVTINHDTGATAANRILTSTGQAVELPNNGTFTFVYSTSGDDRWTIVGGTGSGEGGGGVSDPDALLIQNFDDAVITDFTYSGAELETINTIHGAQSLKFVHDSVATEYLEQTVAVDPKFRGVNITASVTVLSSASDGNVTFVVTDVTNSTTLTTQNIQTNSVAIASLTTANLSTTVSGFSNSDINTLSVGMLVTGTGIPAGTFITAISTTANTVTLTNAATASGTVTLRFSDLSRTVQLGFKIPANCGSIKYRINALPESGAPATYVDDVVLRNYFLGTSVQGQSEIEVPVITTQSSYVNNATAVTAGSSVTGATSSTGGSSSSIYSYNSGTGVYTILENCVFTISAALTTSNATPIQSRISKNGSVVMQDGSNASGIGFSANSVWSGDAVIGDTFLVTNGNGTTSANAVTASATAYSTTPIQTVDIVPARAVLGNTSIDVPVVTEWTSYTPTFQGFGTPTNVEFQWRQNAENVEVRGKFTSGTSTATEARIGLPNGYTSATTAKIPSIQLVGYGHRGVTASAAQFGILVEPSVTYFTIDAQATGTAGLSKLNGNGILNTSDTFSFFASLPISGLSATEEVVVSGTQQALVEEADSVLSLTTLGSGASGFGSTNTAIARFTTIDNSIGSDILYQDSATSGASFTIQTSGIYSISWSASTDSAASIGISKNSTQLTTDILAITSTNRLAHGSISTAGIDINVAWEGYLVSGDVIRPHGSASTSVTVRNARNRFTIAKQGSLKVATVNADQKIKIPTSELRFEGASARGAVATAIVKFDTLAKIRGDAFTVTNTANDGTYVTMTKAGRVNIGASCSVTGTGGALAITLNQTTLTAIPTNNEVKAFDQVYTSTGFTSVSSTFDVISGDVIRVAASGVPSASSINQFQLSFQEQDIQVSVSNTLPQFSESDSSVRLDTANGFGSTATKIRRFSNVRENLGTSVTYTDSATNGASFTINENGVYNISYSDIFTGSVFFGISKNASSLTTDASSISSNERLAGNTTAAGSAQNVSWQGYLVVGDVIRAHTNTGTQTNTDLVSFTISKVGKPNVTGVDVTPFIEVPQPESQLLRADSASAASNTAATGFVTVQNAGASLLTPSSNRITANANCNVSISWSGTAAAAGIRLALYKNGVFYQTSTSAYTSTAVASGSSELSLFTGDYLEILGDNSASTTTSIRYNLVATANSNQILTAPETFNSDTAAFQYAGSASYTLSTLANAPVGTYITFVHTGGSNTRTQTTTRPTQTDADMNTNGILLTPRAYNATSIAATPSAFAIQIGKGFKGKTLDLYKSTNKTTGGVIEMWDLSTTMAGISFKDYNELTGVLFIDVGFSFTATDTARIFYFSDNTTQSNGYVTINASKNPALTGLGLNRVAARAIQTSGTSFTSGVITTLTWDSAKTFDTTGALNTSTGVYTCSDTGYYQVNVNYSVAEASVSTHRLYLYKNGTPIAENNLVIPAAVSATYTNVINDVVFLNKGDTLDTRFFQNSGVLRGASTTVGANYFSIAKISI